MMNHSFEHMPESRAVLGQLAGLLDRDHTVTIAVPLSSSYAWEKYGIDWVQFDAPRHFYYLHGAESTNILADQTGFDVFGTAYNSTEFQFWGSEQHARDIPLRDPRADGSGAGDAAVTRPQMAVFEAATSGLNEACRGDQATFHLRLKR